MKSLFKIKEKLESKYKDLNIRVTIYSTRFHEFPILEVRNWSNHFYAFRLEDERLIPHGDKLNGKGLSAAQVYKEMAKEAKAYRVALNQLKEALGLL